MRLKCRVATETDLPGIVRMLADDFLGNTRELFDDPLPASYLAAFREIQAEPHNELIAAELDGDLVGTLQLTYTPSLSFMGSRRCTVESVRIDAPHRGRGLGRELMLWAVERARSKGCRWVQLTTNLKREDTPRFYESLGFKRTHLGMKLELDDQLVFAPST